MDRQDLRSVALARAMAGAGADLSRGAARASAPAMRSTLPPSLPACAHAGAPPPAAATLFIDSERAEFAQCGGVRWHLRRAGAAALPRMLLLHGTGSASSSWLRILPSLQAHFHVLAPDLPGHGLTGTLPGREGIEEFAAALAALLRDLDEWPRMIVGHSAGAAIAARMALDAGQPPLEVLSINGALRPLNGWTAATFLPLARLVGLNPFVPSLVGAFVASLATRDRAAVRRLLDATGSRIDAVMIEHYEQLMRSPAHVAGTLRMLASWDLRPLLRDLPRLGARLNLLAGLGDRTVAPADARWLQERVPGSARIELPGLGHLAHEEAPAAVAEVVLSVARARGVLAAPARDPSPTQERGS
jgi:magnesium chelatase accessory protein